MERNKMEQLRETINAMISSENCDTNELVRKSQELDELIYEELKKNIYIKNVLGYEYMKEFNAVLDKIHEIKRMYDLIRIVDPLKNEVLDLKADELCTTDSNCYVFWQRHEACKNCISTKSYNEDDVFIKMEYVDDSIYIITSVPIFFGDKKLVVELLKKVSDKKFMDNIILKKQEIV